MDSFFDRALAEARRLGASDVHLKPGQQPILRIGGELRTFNVPALSRDFLQSLALSLLSDRRREALERGGDVTVVFATAAGRQRVHIFQQRGGLGLSLRLIRGEIPALDSLGLPAEIRELTDSAAGLVLVAASPGDGRTTTLGAMIDDVAARRHCRVLTIEDPAEYLHRRTEIVQREVGTDAPTAAAALRAAARQDAELVAVDPLGDLEAAELALAAAETGQLVLAGIAAGSVAGAIGRLTRFWAPEARAETRARLAAALRGVVFQRLAASADGKRRTAAGDLLRVLPETRTWIRDGAAPASEGAQEIPGRTPFEPAPPAARRRRGATAEAQPAVEDDAEPD
jgi:twitching motility protein PilT